MFDCISKNFPKNIFWCLENTTRKRQTQKTRTKPRLTLDARQGSTARCFASSSLTTAPSITISRSTASLHEIPIDDAISRSVDRDLAKARSQSQIAIDGAGASERRRLELGACERRGLVRACLSLSLSEIHLK